MEFSLPESMKRKCEWCGEMGAPLNEALATCSYGTACPFFPSKSSRPLTMP